MAEVMAGTAASGAGGNSREGSGMMQIESIGRPPGLSSIAVIVAPEHKFRADHGAEAGNGQLLLTVADETWMMPEGRCLVSDRQPTSRSCPRSAERFVRLIRASRTWMRRGTVGQLSAEGTLGSEVKA